MRASDPNVGRRPTRHPMVASPDGRAGWTGSGPPAGRAAITQEDHMSASTEPARRVALAHIRVPDNVRALDDAHVRALAGSIQLQGMLVPLVVRQDGEGVRARGRLFTASPPRVR